MVLVILKNNVDRNKGSTADLYAIYTSLKKKKIKNL